jgi:hypothetical protein
MRATQRLFRLSDNHVLMVACRDLVAFADLVFRDPDSSVAQPTTTALEAAKEIEFPFPCGCQDKHGAKDIFAPEVICDTHQAIAAAISKYAVHMQEDQ